MKQPFHNLRALLSARTLPELYNLLRSPLQGILFYSYGGYPQDPYGYHPPHEDWWGRPRRHGPYHDPDPGGFWQGFALALLLALVIGATVAYHLLKN